MRAVQPNHVRAALVCLVAALAGAVPVQASGTGQLPAENCVGEAEDARARSAGDSGGEEEGAPPKLTPAFYGRAVTLVASADGLDGQELPISIEAVCDVPRKFAKEAARLAGSDGVALRLSRTTIWEDGALKIGPAATTLIDGADTALVRGRLTRPGAWRQAEDGSRIATFRAGRIEVTD
jgi:hypothetical protein